MSYMDNGSRRVTLGPISQSTLNSRLSINKSNNNSNYNNIDVNNLKSSNRISFGGPSVVQQTRRQSMNVQQRKPAVQTRPTTNNRLLNDPRNISDKSFITNSLKILQTYLLDHNYNQPFNIKTLIRPTTKDFQNIITFLFQQIDPKFTIGTSGKFEEEVLIMLKFLGYPFTIAKSHISAVGSPHAWPSLLACIMWLVELLTYDETSNITMNLPMNDKDFYIYLSQSYSLFLNGNDDHYERLQQQFISNYEDQTILLQDQLVSITQRNSLIENDITELDKRRNYLPILQSKRNDYLQDLNKFEQLIDQLNKHVELLENKTNNRKNDLLKVNNAIDILNKEISDINNRLNCQEISAEDLQQMVFERERLDSTYQSASENRQKLQRSLLDINTQLRDKLQALEDSTKAYNKLAEDLKLIPASAKNARNRNLSIEIDIRTKKPTGLLKTDITNYLLPILQSYQSELIEGSISFRDNYQLTCEQLDEIESDIYSKTEQSTELTNKINKIDENYRREKEIFDQSNSYHTKEIDLLETKLTNLRDVSGDESRYTQAIRHLTDLKLARDTYISNYQSKKQSINEQILEAISLTTSQHEEIVKGIDGVKSKYNNKLSQLLNHFDDQLVNHLDSKPMTTFDHVMSPIFNQEPIDLINQSDNQIVNNLTNHFNNYPNNYISSYKSKNGSNSNSNQKIYNIQGLINECARQDHNLLDDSTIFDK